MNRVCITSRNPINLPITADGSRVNTDRSVAHVTHQTTAIHFTAGIVWRAFYYAALPRGRALSVVPCLSVCLSAHLPGRQNTRILFLPRPPLGDIGLPDSVKTWPPPAIKTQPYAPEHCSWATGRKRYDKSSKKFPTREREPSSHSVVPATPLLQY